MKSDVSTVTEKGQVTLPAGMRRALGLKPKDRVVFELDEKEKVLRVRRAESVVDKWFGFAGKLDHPMTDKELREAFEQGVADEVMSETE